MCDLGDNLPVNQNRIQRNNAENDKEQNKYCEFKLQSLKKYEHRERKKKTELQVESKPHVLARTHPEVLTKTFL
jgi:hypothetical protein